MTRVSDGNPLRRLLIFSKGYVVGVVLDSHGNLLLGFLFTRCKEEYAYRYTEIGVGSPGAETGRYEAGYNFAKMDAISSSCNWPGAVPSPYAAKVNREPRAGSSMRVVMPTGPMPITTTPS